MNSVKCGLILLSVATTLTFAPQTLPADEPTPFKLIVEADRTTIPPLIPLQLVIRLKNITEERVTLLGNWKDTLQIKLFRDDKLLGKTGYGNLGLFATPTPIESGGELVHLFILQHVGPRRGKEDIFWSKPGEYVVKVTAAYDLWDEQAKEPVFDDDVLHTDDLEVTVRPPTAAERGALKLLEESEKAVKMLRAADDPVHPFLIRSPASEEGRRVLNQIVERFPNTIYADFANYALGRHVRQVDEARKLSVRERERRSLVERVKYLAQVDAHSQLLHQRAMLWKNLRMLSRPSWFPDADWTAAVRELEKLGDVAQLLNVPDWYGRAVPQAKALAAEQNESTSSAAEP